MTAQGPPPSWDTIAGEYDKVVTPMAMTFAEGLLDRVEIGPDTKLLDVAAGSGALSIPAARRGAQVVATDIAGALIERLRARAQAEDLSNVEAHVMDGQALDLDDDAFDVSASQFSISLFPDPQRGLDELARVTKPGGQVLVAVFGAAQTLEFLGSFLSAVQATVPGFTPPDFSDAPPTRLADPQKLRRMLGDAGLRDVTVDTTTWRMPFRDGSHLWDLVLASNPIGAVLVADLTEEQRTEVKTVLDGMLRERSNGNGGVLTNDINVGIGTK